MASNRGFGAGVLAAIPGAVDLLRVERAGSLPAALVHGLGNILALLIAFANLALRWDQQSSSVMWTGLALSTIIVTILLVTSWVGGELAYKHGVGVSTSIGEGSPRDGSA
ncbi:MAG TPA: DUF2231 domain-containing protein [Clostridia bacterium]|nr:DUF2231 domain-containing protein [Clostridia bacterium]